MHKAAFFHFLHRNVKSSFCGFGDFATVLTDLPLCLHDFYVFAHLFLWFYNIFTYFCAVCLLFGTTNRRQIFLHCNRCTNF